MANSTKKTPLKNVNKDTATIFGFQTRHWIRAEKCVFPKRWFNGKYTFAALCWLCVAITPTGKVLPRKTTTFSESWGRKLSHGPKLEKFSLRKNIEEKGILQKNEVFVHFSCPHRKIFQVAAIRTILTPEALPWAHLEAYAPNLSKFGLLPVSEVSRSSIVSKMSVFQPLFGENN